MDAPEIANWLTLALGAATVWLGFETRRMAKATKESVELQAQPHLALVALDAVLRGTKSDGTLVAGAAARLALRLSNPGSVLVNYEVETLAVTFDGIEVEHPKFETRGGVIHPKSENKFFFPWITTQNVLRPGMVGEIKLKINFWASLLSVQHVTARLTYELQSIEPPYIEWIYLEGPTYA